MGGRSRPKKGPVVSEGGILRTSEPQYFVTLKTEAQYFVTKVNSGLRVVSDGEGQEAPFFAVIRHK